MSHSGGTTGVCQQFGGGGKSLLAVLRCSCPGSYGIIRVLIRAMERLMRSMMQQPLRTLASSSEM